jgi:hypothetical protein
LAQAEGADGSSTERTETDDGGGGVNTIIVAVAWFLIGFLAGDLYRRSRPAFLKIYRSLSSVYLFTHLDPKKHEDEYSVTIFPAMSRRADSFAAFERIKQLVNGEN